MRGRGLRFAWTVCVLLAAAGCAVRKPQTYRLTTQSSGPILIPPGVATAEWSRVAIRPGVPRGRGTCPSNGGAIEIRRRGGEVRLVVNRDELLRQPPGWLSHWAALAEEQGCVAAGEGTVLALRIVESVALSPRAGYQLLHVRDLPTGYLDIGPENRLQVDSPILKSGAAADAPLVGTTRVTGASGDGRSLQVETTVSADLIGYERAWYAIRPKVGGIGASIVPMSAERTIEGKKEAAAGPAVNHLQFPPQAAFYRLFYRGDQTIAVLFAATRAELDRRTERMAAGSGTCEEAGQPVCVQMPRNVGMNAFVVVVVNGREAVLPVGATIRSAILTEEKKPESTLARLKVRRRYRAATAAVEFDPGNAVVLDMVLAGGEEISWK